MAPNVRQLHCRVRNGRCSQPYVSDDYFGAAESSARGGGQKARYCSQPLPVALRLRSEPHRWSGGGGDKTSTQKLCREIPSPRSAGAKLSNVPFKDQIASGPGWLS